MNIMTRRNAVIGYLALQALKRARRNTAVGYIAAQGVERTRARRRTRRALRVPLYVAIGIVSLGILAAVAAHAAKRKPGSALEEPELVQASSVDGAADVPAEEDAPAASEPAPAA
jgi:hypothetical protein